jgi:hypothetical protein
MGVGVRRTGMKRWVVLVALLLGGCATGTAARTPARDPLTPESQMASSMFSPKPSIPPAEVTVTGTVEMGVERGCRMLRTSDDVVYQLVGSADPRIQAGARLTVRGRPDPGLITTCQQGTPLRVIEIQD